MASFAPTLGPSAPHVQRNLSLHGGVRALLRLRLSDQPYDSGATLVQTSAELLAFDNGLELQWRVPCAQRANCSVAGGAPSVAVTETHVVAVASWPDGSSELLSVAAQAGGVLATTVAPPATPPTS